MHIAAFFCAFFALKYLAFFRIFIKLLQKNKQIGNILSKIFFLIFQIFNDLLTRGIDILPRK